VVEQAEIMRTHITHHLDRARVAARSSVIGDITDVDGVLQALKRTLDRIYEERGLDVEVVSIPGLKFQGEKQDFEEMVGNLLDNACKWATSRVRAEARRGERPARFMVVVDDDGPGLTEAERAKVGQRGQRLDESKPGSGLGLSIVADLAHLYKGSLALEPSPEGGLRARLELPVA
jgi:signal transduction histidine kinase